MTKAERASERLPGLVDSHAHLQDRAFAEDIAQVMQRAGEAGIEAVVCIGYDLESSREAVALARRCPSVYAAVGIHPHDARTADEKALARLMALAREPKVVAIGEIGLDYYRDLSPREAQAQAFRAQIRLARELGKPVVVHDRDAHEDVLNIIKKEKAGANGGVMHCYSGQLPLATELMRLGFYISFAGPLTFKNSRRSVEVAARIPLDKILVETDCPYLTPEPWRGKRNEPAHVGRVVRKLAEIKGRSVEETAYLTGINARRIFALRD